MNDLSAITRRLQWIAEENAALKTKTLALVARLDIDMVLWEEIANIESHTRNALARLPETQEAEA